MMPGIFLWGHYFKLYLQNFDSLQEKINDDELYRVAAGLYSAQMLSVVGSKSFGLLSIVPKDKNGAPLPITKIISFTTMATKLKNGLPRVPLYYSIPQGRKIIDTSHNIIAQIKSPNKIALTLYLIIIIIIVLIVFIIILISKRRKRKRKAK